MCTSRLAEREGSLEQVAKPSFGLIPTKSKEEDNSDGSSTESDDEGSLELECRENMDEDDAESEAMEEEDIESKVFPQQRFSPLHISKSANVTSKRSLTPDVGKVRHSPVPFVSRRAVTPDICHHSRVGRSNTNKMKATCTLTTAKQLRAIQVISSSSSLCSSSKQSFKTTSRTAQHCTESNSSVMFVKPATVFANSKPGLTISGSFQPKGSVFKPSIPSQQLLRGKSPPVTTSALHQAADEKVEQSSSMVVGSRPCPVGSEASLLTSFSVGSQLTSPKMVSSSGSLVTSQLFMPTNAQAMNNQNANPGSFNRPISSTREQMGIFSEVSMSSKFHNMQPFYAPLTVTSHNSYSSSSSPPKGNLACYQAPLSPRLSPGTSGRKLKPFVAAIKAPPLPVMGQIPVVLKPNGSSSRLLLPAQKSVVQTTQSTMPPVISSVQTLAQIQANSVPLAPRLSPMEQWQSGLSYYSVAPKYVGDPQKTAVSGQPSPAINQNSLQQRGTSQLLSKGQLKSFQGTSLAIYHPPMQGTKFQQQSFQPVLAPKVSSPGPSDQTVVTDAHHEGLSASYHQSSPFTQPQKLTNGKLQETKIASESAKKGETTNGSMKYTAQHVYRSAVEMCETQQKPAQWLDTQSPVQHSATSEDRPGCGKVSVINNTTSSVVAVDRDESTSGIDAVCGLDTEKSLKAKTILKRFVPDGMEQ